VGKPKVTEVVTCDWADCRKQIVLLGLRFGQRFLLKRGVARRPALRTADPFWQSRYYDFNVWSKKKFVEKLRDIHRNPVQRGFSGADRGLGVEQFPSLRDGGDGYGGKWALCRNLNNSSIIWGFSRSGFFSTLGRMSESAWTKILGWPGYRV
jgi:hypothetical protein